MFQRSGYFISAVLLVMGSPLWAQVDASTARLRGAVIDASGAGVSGATVVARNTARGTKGEAIAGSAGAYSIALLPPGTYDLDVEAKGFEKAHIAGLDLSVGATVEYDVHLAVGMMIDTVSVEAEPPLVMAEQTQQANTLEERQISNLPNSARNFAESIYTLPGVTSSDAPRTQSSAAFTPFVSSGFSIGGSNGRNNLVTIDGGENEYGSGALRTPNISVDSVQEFQVNRNAFAAEFGFTAGTAINVITRSGSNKFHGSAYTYFLDQSTEARNYFDATPGKPFEQHVFPGASFGGPLVKDKLFFFTSYELHKLNTPQFRDYVKTPEAAGLSANAAQQAYLGALKASGNPFLAGFAAQLGPALAPTNNPLVNRLLSSNSGIFDDQSVSHDWVTRVDYQPNQANALTVRFSIERYRYTSVGGSSLLAPSDAARTIRNDTAILATWNRTVSANVVNTARVQVVPTNTSSQLSYSPNSTQLSIGALGTFGQNFGNPYYLTQRRFQFEDALSVMKGSHTLKLGASYRPVSYNIRNDLWFGGEFDFFDGTVPLISLAPAALQPGLAQFNAAIGLPATGNPATNLSALQSFSLGVPVLYRQGFGNSSWQSWAHYLGVFAQDSWKATQHLTVDYGVRLDYDAEPSPVPHNAYVSPRLGIAWDATGDNKTLIRAGSGLFVSPVNFQVPYLVNLLSDSGNYINQIARQLGTTDKTVPTLWGLGLQEGKLPFGQLSASDLGLLGITPAPRAPGRVIFNLAPNYKNTYSIQASMSVSRQLASNFVLEVGYMMYRGVHIQMDQETNYRETGVIDPVYGPQYAPINPSITQQNSYSSIGNSIYHGMTTSLTKRFSRGLQFQTNYTWSKSIDDVTDFNSQFASFWPTRLYLDRGISAFNIKNNFTANAVYTTPGRNWLVRDITISPIVYARSGIPFTITVPGAANGTAGHSLYARPWYVARNTGLGPAFYSFDLRVEKAVFISRERGLAVRLTAEGSNLLNHTNFLAVNNVFPVGDPRLLSGPFNLTGQQSLSASQPLGFTAASNPRQIQFGLRIAF